MKSLLPSVKGIITGLAMIAFSLIVFYGLHQPAGSYQYVVYLLYTAGIVWSLLEFNKTATADTKFKDYFSYAFKTFIVVVLFMVIYTFIFFSLHPEIRDNMIAENNKLLLQQANHTPAEIEMQAKSMKNIYMMVMVSGALFLYLISGAVISGIASAIMLQKKKN